MKQSRRRHGCRRRSSQVAPGLLMIRQLKLKLESTNTLVVKTSIHKDPDLAVMLWVDSCMPLRKSPKFSTPRQMPILEMLTAGSACPNNMPETRSTLRGGY